MKSHPSETNWMHRTHHPRGHAIHLHPIHWFAKHPMALALLITGLLALAIILLANRTNTGIRMDTLTSFDYSKAQSNHALRAIVIHDAKTTVAG